MSSIIIDYLRISLESQNLKFPKLRILNLEFDWISALSAKGCQRFRVLSCLFILEGISQCKIQYSNHSEIWNVFHSFNSNMFHFTNTKFDSWKISYFMKLIWMLRISYTGSMQKLNKRRLFQWAGHQISRIYIHNE